MGGFAPPHPPNPMPKLCCRITCRFCKASSFKNTVCNRGRMENHVQFQNTSNNIPTAMVVVLCQIVCSYESLLKTPSVPFYRTHWSPVLPTTHTGRMLRPHKSRRPPHYCVLYCLPVLAHTRVRPPPHHTQSVTKNFATVMLGDSNYSEQNIPAVTVFVLIYVVCWSESF